MSVDPVAVMAHRDRVLYGRDDPVTMVEDDIPYCESCGDEWPCDTSRALGEATDD